MCVFAKYKDIHKKNAFCQQSKKHQASVHAAHLNQHPATEGPGLGGSEGEHLSASEPRTNKADGDAPSDVYHLAAAKIPEPQRAHLLSVRGDDIPSMAVGGAAEKLWHERSG